MIATDRDESAINSPDLSMPRCGDDQWVAALSIEDTAKRQLVCSGQDQLLGFLTNLDVQFCIELGPNACGVGPLTREAPFAAAV